MNVMNRFVGILLIMLSAAAFDTIGTLGHFAFAEGMDALSIKALRSSLAALVILVVLLFHGERMPLGGIQVRLVGMLTLVFSVYYTLAARNEMADFFQLNPDNQKDSQLGGTNEKPFFRFPCHYSFNSLSASRNATTNPHPADGAPSTHTDTCSR